LSPVGLFGLEAGKNTGDKIAGATCAKLKVIRMAASVKVLLDTAYLDEGG